ncbi:AIR synthase related protein [Candidatus Clostridium radicumherbarum]|uniref:AIR synthase related protein n=1 Tax=Candidatus Clostridium radicumherbarum TaxID=3381662 RepID=A0ABW8TPI1_9CLOT
MKLRKVRDLSLVDLDNKTTLVIACDSCGGIGMKEGDALKVPPLFVGKFAARVPLLEVLSTGAEVMVITNNVCNEMEPTGKEMIRGISEELAEAYIDDAVLTGSTEENFKTISTAVGVTVMGLVPNNLLRVNTAAAGSYVISIGLPKVGDEINYLKDDEIITYLHLKTLLGLNYVYEIIPVGSKGIAYECEQMALYNNLKFNFEKNLNVNIQKSSGPATCVIAAVKADSIGEINEIVPNVNIIGRLM